ncbi:MAG TPA: hypothetical protein ENK50_05215 [Sedimenticola sp.]|nr:hypothetical protein [Sedimenticola sp.]
MTPPLAKISRPRQSEVLPRERLFRRLAEEQRPLVWVTGPPGAGKTTLLSSYLDVHPQHCLWFQVDARDADPATFFHFLGLALAGVGADDRGPPPPLTPEYLAGIETYARNFFESLFSQLETPFLLVFDNFQELPEESPLLPLLARCFSAIPPGGRMVFLSRAQPPAAFAELRLRDAIALLDWGELRFDRDETRAFLAWRGLETDDEGTLDRIQGLVQGWVAGLILLLEQPELLRDEGGLPSLPESLFDFFASRILDGLPPATRDFLLQTAFFPQFTAPMARALGGREDTESLLTRLTRGNYFVSRRPGREPVYEYHALFRAFLLARARQDWDASVLEDIRLQAAVILEADGQVEAALEHLYEAGDWPAMARILLGQAAAWLARGQWRVLEHWLLCLPEVMLGEEPWLRFWLACARLPGAPPEARRLFDDARADFAARGDRAGTLLAWAGAVDAVNFELADCTLLDAYIREFESFGCGVEDLPAGEAGDSIVCALFSALVLRQPHHPETDLWAGQVEERCLRSGNMDLRMRAAYALTLYRMWSADFVGARLVIDSLPKGEVWRTASPLVQMQILVTEAMYRWLAAEPETALARVEEGVGLAERTGVFVGVDQLLEHGTAAALTLADHARAESLLARLSNDLPQARLGDLAYQRYLLYWDALLRGDRVAAARFGSTLAELGERLGYYYGIGLAWASQAQLAAAQGRHAEAAASLRKCRHLARRAGARLLEFQAGVLEAGLLLERPRAAGRLRAVLRRTLALGRRQGIRNCFGWDPALMTRLCLRALEEGVETDYVRQLIRLRGLRPPAPPLELENWPWSVRVFSLGRFAVQIQEGPKEGGRTLGGRPWELLRALVALGGREVDKSLLADALWPDAEGDAAQHAFETTLYGCAASSVEKAPSS